MRPNQRHWILLISGLVFLLLIAGLVFLDVSIDDKRAVGGVLGPSFELDLSRLKHVDSNLLVGVELTPMFATVAKPRGIAVDLQDRVYVGGEREVAVLSSNGGILTTFRVERPADCVAVETNGTILVGAGDRIIAYDLAGKRLEEWPSLGRKAAITSLAAIGAEVFAADAGNQIVWRLRERGGVRDQIGGKAREQGTEGFVIPSPYFDLAAGIDGTVWVVDPGRHALLQFSRDGGVLSSWSKTGTEVDGFSGCCNPSHIALRSDGTFVTSEKGIPRVKIYSQAGTLVGVVAGPGSFDNDHSGLDLAVDRKGRILVLDTVRRQVRVFRVKGEPGA